MTTFKSYLNEANLSRVYSHTKDRNIGMITANRGELPAEENVKRNRSLESDIKSHGYGYTHVKGTYVENKGEHNERKVTEHSYLVIGKKGHDGGNLKGFLKKHGEKYGQDSVLHKSHDSDTAQLHGTGNSEWIKKGDVKDAGKWHPNRASEFQSVLRNKKSFTFESVEYIRPANGISYERHDIDDGELF